MTALKFEREQKRMTALQLAQAAGTSENRIYQLERGRFRPRALEAAALADVLQTPAEILFPDGVQTMKSFEGMQ